MYSSYTAASFARIYELMDQYQANLQGAVSWSFEFEDQEWFAGFRELATHGIDKPVLNVFRMFGMMGGQRVAVVSDHGVDALEIIANGVRDQRDISAIACKDGASLSVMVWNYHDDDLTSASPPVRVSINGIDQDRVLVQHYRIDAEFSNSFEAWKAMGSPQDVTSGQYAILEQAGQLQLYTSPEWKKTENQTVDIEFDLPAQGVSLVRLSW
jgi:xylan 1,4-beta-xylosidase